MNLDKKIYIDNWDIKSINEKEREIINPEKSFNEKLKSLKELDVLIGENDTDPNIHDLIEYLQNWNPPCWYSQQSLEQIKYL